MGRREGRKMEDGGGVNEWDTIIVSILMSP